jgi:hypothetical protein
LLGALALGVPGAARAASGHATATRGGATKVVRYLGWHARVPAAWPVYRLSAHPRTCVRFNRHAVYLGPPGAQERCPAHAAGRTEALLVSPLRSTLGPIPTGGAVAQRTRSAGRVVVTATWDRHPAAVASALGVRSVPAAGRAYARRETAAVRAAAHAASGSRGAASDTAVPAQNAPAGPGAVYTGLGFDACSTPSSKAMTAWSKSPFRAVGVYLGGVNMACTQSNLTASWVTAQADAGWHLIPLYVGPQAPGNGCGCAAISPAGATSEGTAAAQSAIDEAQALGLGAGNPIYYDMENYTRTTSASETVLEFLEAWTSTLHSAGYASGVYSSELSGIEDLVAEDGSGYAEPDDIWIANWNGAQSTSDPKVPTADWADHQRLHQYRGAHTDDYGGADIDIDSDYVDAATASPGTGAITTTIAAAPSITVRPEANGTIELSPSWNGESGVTHWEILAGDSATALQPMLTVPASHRTVLTHNAYGYFQVQALGAGNEELGSSGTTATRAHVAIFGQSAYVPARGSGGLPVECFGIRSCRVSTTIRDGRRLLVRTPLARVAAGGGVIHFPLTARAHRLVADAGHRGLAVTVTVRTNTGRSARQVMRLVPFTAVGAGPRRVASTGSVVRILGGTDFVSEGWAGGILVACVRTAPCTASPTLTVGRHTIATSGVRTVGAGEVGYLPFRLTSAGHALLKRARGNQLGVRVKVVAPAEGLLAPTAATAAIALDAF